MQCHACSGLLRADDGALCAGCLARLVAERALEAPLYHVTLHCVGDPDPYPIREWLVDAATAELAEAVMRRVLGLGGEYCVRVQPVRLVNGVHELTAP